MVPTGNGTAAYVPPSILNNLMPATQPGLFLPNFGGPGGATSRAGVVGFGQTGNGGYGPVSYGARNGSGSGPIGYGYGNGGVNQPYNYPVNSPTPIGGIPPIRPVSANGITETPRSVNQGYGVADAWNQERSNNTAAQGTLEDFTKNYLASKPTATGYNDQESGAIGKFYGTGPGSVTGDLATIRRQQAQNIFNASQGAIRRATAANSARRMMSGNNSSNDHTYAQTLAEIAANTAQQQGAQAGNDYRYVADNQNGLAGKRQMLLNNLMMNDLTPLDVRNRYQSNNLQTLGTLGNLENSNSLYDTSGYDRSRLLNELMP